MQSIHDAYVATAKPDVVAVVDTRSQLMTSRSSDISANVSAAFYDSHFNYIGTAQGHDVKKLSPLWADYKRSEEIVADINEQQKVQVKALQQFDQPLSSLLTRPTDKVSILNNTMGIKLQ